MLNTLSLCQAFRRVPSQGLSRHLQSRPNVILLSLLPPILSRCYLGLLGRLYFKLARLEERTIRVALGRAAGGRTGAKRWRRVRAGIIDHYHEKLLLGFRPLDWVRRLHTQRVRVSGLAHLDEALALGRGAIVVTGHYGAVEFIPGALAFRGYPVTIMVHCKTAALRVRLEEKSAQVGVRLLDPKAGSALFSAMKDLRQGRVLVTQCDELEMRRPYKDRRIDFLGLNLGLDRSLDILARKSRAPVLFGLAHRLGGQQYQLAVEKPEEHPAARGHELVSAKCLAVLSDYILARPEAWYEWKKLEPLGDESLIRDSCDKDSQRLSLPDPVAVYAAGPA